MGINLFQMLCKSGKDYVFSLKHEECFLHEKKSEIFVQTLFSYIVNTYNKLNVKKYKNFLQWSKKLWGSLQKTLP